jgi:hypothetical protein
MNAYLPALAALAGSVVGALASILATWLNHHYQARAGERTRKISQREDLFRDFIVAASKAYGEALTSEEPRVEELLALHAWSAGCACRARRAPLRAPRRSYA